MDILTVIFYQPIFNFIIVLYRLFGENLGLAIILIALISRLITLPISLRQQKMMGTNQEMQAKMNEIKKKHKNDKKRQQEEMARVQSEYLPAQLSGCLPAILQFILFINIYNVINNLIKGAESFNIVAYPFVEKFVEGYQLHTSFFGIVDLKTTAASIGFNNLQILPYIIFIILAALTQYFSIKMSLNQNKKSADQDTKDSKKDSKLNPAEDFSSALQQSTQQTMLLFPLMIAVFSYSIPIGLSIYWIAQNLFVIIQTLLLKRLNLKAGQSEKAVI